MFYLIYVGLSPEPVPLERPLDLALAAGQLCLQLLHLLPLLVELLLQVGDLLLQATLDLLQLLTGLYKRSGEMRC